MSADRQDGLTVLAGASLLTAVLGSVHAFSVFLEPLEVQFGASRGAVSLTYSGALICLTVAVLFGHRIYDRASAPALILISAAVAAAGALLAGVAPGLPLVWLGYSVLFGAANGLGYGFGLQIAAQANPGREGVAMGVVTAAYALGAVLSPALFSGAVAGGGFGLAMVGLALVLIMAGLISAALLRMGHARYRAETVGTGGTVMATKRLMLIWLGYFGGVMAGLMVIGHAAGIAAAANPEGAAWIAPVVIAVCNLGGSLIAGRAADRVPAHALLSVLPALTVIALLALVLLDGGLMIWLGLAGFAYGGTIAAYPSVIAKAFGMEASARIYGRVFTAWGTAGLAGPWLAGALYDATGAYPVALLVAAGIGAVSVVVAWAVFRA